MWLYESLVKEFLCRCWGSALGVGVMEGVYIYAASVNQRSLMSQWLLQNKSKLGVFHPSHSCGEEGRTAVDHAESEQQNNQFYHFPPLL